MQSTVYFGDDKLKETYLKLQTSKAEEKMLFKWMTKSISDLKENSFYGTQVPKRLIPNSLIKEGIQNLYRVELSNFWRMLYTIEGTKIEILVFVLKIMNHKEYDKLFGYK